MQTWADVALLTKAKTQVGGFVVRCTAGLSFFLEPGQELVFVPPQIDCPRKARIVSVEHICDMQAHVVFDSFTSMEQMQNLIGAHCLLPADAMTPQLKRRAGIELDGMLVIDEQFGKLGSVSRVIVNPGQCLLEVDGMNRGYGDILIPYVDAFILEIDKEEQIIYVAIPAGLLEL